MQDIVFIISRNTNASQNAKQHAINSNGKPLCDDKPRGKFNGWSHDKGEVTCEKCLQILSDSVE